MNFKQMTVRAKLTMTFGLLAGLVLLVSGLALRSLGDANDKYGGLGRNGTQKMEASDVDRAYTRMLPSTESYRFTSKKFFNLESSDYVKGHSDITGKEVANAVRCAVAGASS